MKISEVGLRLIRAFEGFSAKPYICAAGYPTIGVGHVIKPGEHFDYITEAEAIRLLQQDVSIAESSVRRNITYPINQQQFDALCSFTFNLGGGALQRSTLRSRLNRGDIRGAAEQFPKWSHGNGRKLKGLLRRRLAEQELFLSDKVDLWKEQEGVF